MNRTTNPTAHPRRNWHFPLGHYSTYGCTDDGPASSLAGCVRPPFVPAAGFAVGPHANTVPGSRDGAALLIEIAAPPATQCAPAPELSPQRASAAADALRQAGNEAVDADPTRWRAATSAPPNRLRWPRHGFLGRGKIVLGSAEKRFARIRAGGGDSALDRMKTGGIRVAATRSC